MNETPEAIVCLSCGGSDIDEFQTCTECDITNIAPLSEYERWCKIKGSFQLFTGNDIQEPSVVIPLHLNKMGWIVADVVNTAKTIFPDLSQIIEYDKAQHKQLLTEHQIAYHTRCIKTLVEENHA